MAKYIHTLEDRRYGDEEDLRFLIRHIGHDFENDIIESKAKLNIFLREKKENHIHEVISKLSHTGEITHAIASLKNN